MQERPSPPPRERDGDPAGADGQTIAEPLATNGHTVASAARPAPSEPAASNLPPPSTRRRRLLLIVPILFIVGAVALFVGLRFWVESTYFVMTDNAEVTGSMVQVGSLNAGRIVQATVDVGQTVTKDQVVAVVAVPQQVGNVPLTDQPILDQTGSVNAQVPVRSPIDGVVAARMGSVGGTVSAGQAIYTLVDPRHIWVQANIDEDKVSRVQPGQEVEVHSVALGKSFQGRVRAVAPASAATFSLLPAQNLSGNFNKVTQWVPVKIDVDTGGEVLPLGTSVDVRIRVQEGG